MNYTHVNNSILERMCKYHFHYGKKNHFHYAVHLPHNIPVMTLDVSAANKSSARIPGLLALCKPYKKQHPLLNSNVCSNKSSRDKLSPVGVLRVLLCILLLMHNKDSCTVEPCVKIILLIRSPRYYGSFLS